MPELTSIYDVVCQSLDQSKFNLVSSVGRKVPYTGDRDHRLDYSEWAFFEVAAGVLAMVRA
jgi:hypothetical protein